MRQSCSGPFLLGSRLSCTTWVGAFFASLSVDCAVSYLLKSSFHSLAASPDADSNAGETDADSTYVNYTSFFSIFSLDFHQITLFSINDCHVKALSQASKKVRRYAFIILKLPHLTKYSLCPRIERGLMLWSY